MIGRRIHLAKIFIIVVNFIIKLNNHFTLITFFIHIKDIFGILRLVLSLGGSSLKSRQFIAAL